MAAQWVEMYCNEAWHLSGLKCIVIGMAAQWVEMYCNEAWHLSGLKCIVMRHGSSVG